MNNKLNAFKLLFIVQSQLIRHLAWQRPVTAKGSDQAGWIGSWMPHFLHYLLQYMVYIIGYYFNTYIGNIKWKPYVVYYSTVNLETLEVLEKYEGLIHLEYFCYYIFVHLNNWICSYQQL